MDLVIATSPHFAARVTLTARVALSVRVLSVRLSPPPIALLSRLLASLLAVEFLEKVDLDFVATTIDDIIDLDEGAGATDPAVGEVDETGESKGFFGFLEVAV
ncbi:hypothetical protein LOK49_LG01G02538 [Camellia lanceoleosa]|uniref:Uncharacterized protein n=1 Tax=Camellia lanceoleosa TaxID=1840588 RepID=A0ACC0J0X6_9ERIC|nr:hypothetical protein LOK49_LG01G02538 [Camellia lanceoleosa]